MEPTYGKASVISATDPRQVNIRELMSKLDPVLRPFAKGEDDDRRRQDLTSIIFEGAQFGYRLCTQSSEWDFDWKRPLYTKSSKFVVFPAFLKIVDDNGHVLPVPELRDAATLSKEAF